MATWVPAKAKKRKRTVPANSPAMATIWLRRASGRVRAKGIRGGVGVDWVFGWDWGWKKGMVRVREGLGGLMFILVL